MCFIIIRTRESVKSASAEVSFGTGGELTCGGAIPKTPTLRDLHMAVREKEDRVTIIRLDVLILIYLSYYND